MKWLMLLATLIATTSSFAGQEPSLNHVGSWLTAQTIDPITDQPRVTAILTQSDATFAVRCVRGKPQLLVETRYQYKSGDRVAFVLRIDSSPATISEWGPEVGTNRAWSGISRATYSAILKAKKIAIEVWRKGDASTYYQFNASKTEDALSAMAKACPIESAKDGTPKLFDPDEAPTFFDTKPATPEDH
jgi:hypothetical protein